jgi:TonB family protein
MTGALIYRPNNRGLIAMSFVFAIGIHVTAVVFAENKSNPALAGSVSEGVDIIGVDVPPSPPEVDDTSLPEQPAVNDQEFYDDNITRPIRRKKKVPVAAIRPNISGMTSGMHGGSAKALAVYAPRPNYPYEARRGGTTGSGIAQLIVNSAAGNVIEARMSESTGSSVLDSATLSAFRRWRFKPGVASNVKVPITYTLSGVSY